MTNRSLWNGQARRMLCLKWVVSAALLSGLAFCPRLWMTDRSFPTVPMFVWLPDLPQWACVVLSCLLVSSVTVAALHPYPRRLVLVPPLVAAALVLFDVNRLQPWLYQYALMFGALAMMNWANPEARESRASLAAAGAIVIGLYFWSGIQKANMSFAADVFPRLLQPLGEPWIARLAAGWFLVPIVEVSIALLLLFPRTRRSGVIAAVTMHMLIVLAIGPLGLNTNAVAWPWNIWMIAMVITLFYQNGDLIPGAAWSRVFGKVVVMLLWAMPALNLVGLWDGALSAALYSGRQRDGWIYLTRRGADRLPTKYQSGNAGFSQETSDRFRLDIIRWAESGINVPPYAEPRVYDGVMRALQAVGVPKQDMVLLVRDRPGISNAARTYSVR